MRLRHSFGGKGMRKAVKQLRAQRKCVASERLAPEFSARTSARTAFVNSMYAESGFLGGADAIAERKRC